MCNLNVEFPEAYEYLKEGRFTASMSVSVHSQIPMDQIIETAINRSSKKLVVCLESLRIRAPVSDGSG